MTNGLLNQIADEKKSIKRMVVREKWLIDRHQEEIGKAGDRLVKLRERLFDLELQHSAALKDQSTPIHVN